MWSTYLGGTLDENLFPDDSVGNPAAVPPILCGGLALNSVGDVFVTGCTRSRDFPLVGPFQVNNAGVVDMRTARPFDKPGRNIFLNVAGVENTVADKIGNKGSILASQTFGTEWGILGGFAWGQNKVKTTGFETIGWTNPNLSATQSTSATRNNTGGGNWTIPGTVPAGAGNGLTTGTAIDQAFLLAHNPGLTIQQLDNGIIPRLGRTMDESGTKDRYSGVLSLEWRPSADARFYLDSLYGKKKNDMNRIDMNWVGRNGSMVPLNLTVDREDCANGCVVQHGTFANAQFFLEYRPYKEDVDVKGVNPGFEWNIGRDMKLDGQLNFTKSHFHRESPSVVPITLLGSGVTVEYTNGEVPTISTNIDVNNPAELRWWCREYNISSHYLRFMVETVGTDADVVRQALAFRAKQQRG
jgi:TonB-dependent receptor